MPISTKIGLPIFPPKKQLYPAFFIISAIIDVVVVLPSVPVTPITLHGANFKSISISDVNIAPLSTSAIVGSALGERNIMSKPFTALRHSLPVTISKPFAFTLFNACSFNSFSSFWSNTVILAPKSYK